MVQQAGGGTTTAGMRGANWDSQLMKRPHNMEAFALTTADGKRSLAFLFTASGRERGVISIMHPRELAVAHYMVPWILDAGYACWVQAPRSVGNDLRLEHEIALFDVAAGMVQLRKLGYDHIILMGNSGGAGLYSFYNQQSLLPATERILHTPGGRKTGLDELDMPVADGLIFLSPHPGQGRLLLSGLDPSITDENDPFSTDPALDPFSPDNGFDAASNHASYSADFVARYRRAQVARCQRLDAYARTLLERKTNARAGLKTDAPNLRLAAHSPIFQIWRTDADLRSWDISLDPSDRRTGSLWGRNPFLSNWGGIGFARTVTPESWLSTWSGLCSNASMEKTAGAATQPTLIVEYTGDQCTFPQDIQTIYQQIGSPDKELARIKGNHHGMALEKGEEPGRTLAGRAIGEWLGRKFT